MAKKQEVAVAEVNPKALVLDERPEWLRDECHRGNENVETKDLIIPRLELVQGLSPAVKRGDPGFIPGASLGDLMNTVTKEIYHDPVMVVPVHYNMQYLVWKMRNYIDQTTGKVVTSEGGFFGSYPNYTEAHVMLDQLADAAIEIVETPQQLCLLLHEDGSLEEIMFSMPRTKQKISRQWNTLVKLAGGDRFSRVYQISSVLQTSAKGDFYNYSVKLLGFAPQHAYLAAFQLYNDISEGMTLKADTSDYTTDTVGQNSVTENEF